MVYIFFSKIIFNNKMLAKIISEFSSSEHHSNFAVYMPKTVRLCTNICHLIQS